MGNEPLFEVAAELIAQADSLIVSAGAVLAPWQDYDRGGVVLLQD